MMNCNTRVMKTRVIVIATFNFYGTNNGTACISADGGHFEHMM